MLACLASLELHQVEDRGPPLTEEVMETQQDLGSLGERSRGTA
jgi:hypothetical protein